MEIRSCREKFPKSEQTGKELANLRGDRLSTPRHHRDLFSSAIIRYSYQRLLRDIGCLVLHSAAESNMLLLREDFHIEPGMNERCITIRSL